MRKHKLWKENIQVSDQKIINEVNLKNQKKFQI